MRLVLYALMMSCVVLLASSPVFGACNVSNVCADVSLSLKGTVIVDDDIKIEWETDSEGIDLSHYEVYRFDCEDPECLDYVTSVTPTGTCEETESYDVYDSPPSPVSSWTYQVRVITTSATTQCSINVEPE